MDDPGLEAARREFWFWWFARSSTQILCSEPDGPPVGLVVRPHDLNAMHYGGRCTDCGAQT